MERVFLSAIEPIIELIFLGVLMGVLMGVPLWRICGRAGFHPALSLIALFPALGFLIVSKDSVWHLLLTLFFFVVLPPLLFWRTVSKSGFSPWWALLGTVPMLNIIMLWVVAFVTWPKLSRSYGSAGQQLFQGVVMSEGYKSQYGAAKFVGALTSFVGWVVLVLGVVGAIVGVSMAINLATAQDFDPARQMFIAVAAAGSVFSLQFTLIGLLLAGLGQHFRATADNANHSGEMLALMKSGKA